MAGIRCQIRVKGNLGEQWSEWFDRLTITNEKEGEAVLAGVLADEAALYGALMKIRDLGLALLAVSRDASDQKQEEEV